MKTGHLLGRVVDFSYPPHWLTQRNGFLGRVSLVVLRAIGVEVERRALDGPAGMAMRVIEDCLELRVLARISIRREPVGTVRITGNRLRGGQ